MKVDRNGKYSRTFDEIEHDLIHQCSDILTEWEFYRRQKDLHPDVVIIMRYYDSYHILGDDADKVAPVLEDVLTHKDAGRMFVYDTHCYSYHKFSFGRHNLDKVLPKLIGCNMRVAISDYNIAFKEWGGWQRADRLIDEAKKQRDLTRPGVWVQTSLFDMEGFTN